MRPTRTDLAARLPRLVGRNAPRSSARSARRPTAHPLARARCCLVGGPHGVDAGTQRRQGEARDSARAGSGRALQAAAADRRASHRRRRGGPLDELFTQFGPPLVLKRDNGSNLNSAAVNAVLSRWLVIPLNSPPHYPPYNGGIERSQRELKDTLRPCLLASREAASRPSQVALAVHELNHRPGVVSAATPPASSLQVQNRPDAAILAARERRCSSKSVNWP